MSAARPLLRRSHRSAQHGGFLMSAQMRNTRAAL
jgi:hypothetical protein